MLGEAAKGVITALKVLLDNNMSLKVETKSYLEAMNETQQQSSVHPAASSNTRRRSAKRWTLLLSLSEY